MGVCEGGMVPCTVNLCECNCIIYVTPLSPVGNMENKKLIKKNKKTNSLSHLYADDSVIYSFAPSVNLALQNLQSDFSTIQKTLSDLKLVLNPGKSKYMIFTKKLSADCNSTITTVDEININRVSCYKYLGFWIDDRLSFKTHVAELLKKLKPILALQKQIMSNSTF